MASPQTVARTIRLFADSTLSPEALSRHLAATAKRVRDEAIAAGSAPDSYDTIVDGRLGAAEETVRADGVIVYRFNLLAHATEFGLKQWRDIAPVKSGDYRRSVLVAVNGARWAGPLLDIPRTSEVMLVDAVPYANIVDNRTNIVLQVRQRVRRAFPTIDAAKTYVYLPSTFSVEGYDVPYYRDAKGAFPRQQMLYRALALTSRAG